MSAVKHTPGPWEVDAAYGWIEHSVWPAKAHAQVVARNGESMTPVARCQSNARATDNHANARLIAAAPELLEAHLQIKHSIQQARKPGNDWKRELDLIENTVDAAIAKATGGAP